MARTVSRGKCSSCQRIIAKNAMTKHLATCQSRLARLNELPEGRAKTRHTRLLHLLIEGRQDPIYWMHIEIPADATLRNLDSFLRDVWLECCGHMSMFAIGGRTYSVAPQREYGDMSMGAKVGVIFVPRSVAQYEYDFGSTTELLIKYVAEREGDYRGYDIRVLAQNEPPEYKCAVCGAPATQVCSQCFWEGSGWVCDEHAAEHECGEEMMLPVVNSPRVGVCAYTG